MTRRLQIAVLFSWCSLAALSGSYAQTITSLSATEVAAPDDLALHGTGFLDGASVAKGFNIKVRLIAVDGGKAYKTNFDGANDSIINVRLRKMPAGEYTVRVKRKGVEEFEAPQTLMVRVPELLSSSNSVAFACGRASVNGRFLGVLPGRVKVGGKRAKLLAWRPIFEHDGEPITAAHQAVFVVPRGLGPGPHDVEFSSFAGTDTLASALTVEPTTLPCRMSGESQMAARVDASGLPKKLRSKPSLLVGWTPQSLESAESPSEQDGAGVSAPRAHSSDRLAADVAEPILRALAGTEDATTILGTTRKGKALRVIACVLSGWEPEVGALLQGDDALAFDPVVLLIDFRIQGPELVVEAVWAGVASDVQLAVHTVPPDLLDGRLHLRFSSAELELVEGEGSSTISVTEALILNAREVNL